jgi:hypothetical protein
MPTSVISVREKLILLSASGAGTGHFPLFPGTIGTLVASPFSFALNRLANFSQGFAAVILVAAIFCAIWLATKRINPPAEGSSYRHRQLPNSDGILPRRPRYNFVDGFMLFRFFDRKSFPRRAESSPGVRASCSTTSSGICICYHTTIDRLADPMIAAPSFLAPAMG